MRSTLQANPFGGHVFVFRGRRGDILKVLWFDAQGLLLLAKRLERGRFIWPQATEGRVVLTPAQLSMLLEGIEAEVTPSAQIRCQLQRVAGTSTGLVMFAAV